MQNTQPQHTPLWQRYLTTKAQSSAKYARDIAAEMGISEAELTEARLGYDAVRLQDDARAILTALETVGETKCICRNEYAVHEQVGEFTHQHLSGHAGLVLNPRALDLRLFLSQWASAFRLNDNGRQSIQFFDPHGDALFKVYTTGNTDMAAWDALIAGHTQQSPAPLAIRPAEPLKYADSADAAALENEWRAMTDVHQFFGLLRKYSLSRQQAFRLVSDDLACRIDTQTLPGLLETIRQDGNEIMIFVGNRGCVQIFTGALEKVAPMRGWLNIFNPAFTLHLREESVDEIWVTRKPTSDGHVTSVELFAKDGTQIAQLFGQRSEGHPEQAQWRAQVDRLTTEGLLA
ncbi:hemin-degrading factor [Klebsiella michiganensis]|uniref:hemin-degrading factor n=1 Tax=Klebsiella michiganensis TaxID=1134687 RepID=UPI0016270310|nr:ChuX/HutX family heme-like substrate-binding protein [Klebsiella michiganensis]QNE52397.1 hemin-degrading factor [Klebsiella michiganensis]